MMICSRSFQLRIAQVVSVVSEVSDFTIPSKSLADVPRLSPDRLARFKQQLNFLEDCSIVAAEAG
jgi:hypothetical protein